MTIEFKLPELGENVDSADVVSLLVSEGQQIEGNQGVLELETDKAVLELPCPRPGKIVKILVKPGESIKVGQTLLTIDPEAEGEEVPAEAAPAVETPAEEPAPVAKPATTEPVPVAPPSRSGPIPAGPSARRAARELGVDLRQVSGSGKRGRIRPEDVKAAVGPVVGTEPAVAPGEPGSDSWGPIRTERMSRIRRTIAAQMARSAATIAHVTNFDDADATDLEQLRKSVPKGFLGENIKLTTMPFVMKAVAMALRRHPLLNASIDEENQQIIYKEYVNLGVAVDTPRGLVVPVMRSVDTMTIPDIARSIITIAERARAFQFGIEDLRGGTFTISNLGAVGGAYSTPIINHPEVAILLLGRSRWLPMVRHDKVEPRLMMPLSLSYDHRLVDGATAARFLNEVIDYLQSPGKLLLAGQ
jgi:pyruvate dehydrogenase E2 component (dihydrolipoyllysine-residue acetyltransferase)